MRELELNSFVYHLQSFLKSLDCTFCFVTALIGLSCDNPCKLIKLNLARATSDHSFICQLQLVFWEVSAMKQIMYLPSNRFQMAFKGQAPHLTRKFQCLLAPEEKCKWPWLHGKFLKKKNWIFHQGIDLTCSMEKNYASWNKFCMLREGFQI